MPTIKTGYWIRIQDDKVTQCWDTTPPYQTEAGWREAVEVMPDMLPNREILDGHYFDTTQTPAQIVWNKRSISVDERKTSMVDQAKSNFSRIAHEQIILQMNPNPQDQFDVTVVANEKAKMDARIALIESKTTHEELDAIMV